MAKSKFAPENTTISTEQDRSESKNIVVGPAGVGKTHMLSTIVASDGRVIFILAVEDGLKGASPNHSPAKFADKAGNIILPDTYGDLLQGLETFKTFKNAPRPIPGTIDPMTPAGAVLLALAGVYPLGLPIETLGQQTGQKRQALETLLAALDAEKRLRFWQGAFYAKPDPKTWKRPHCHFGVDSLTGIETLVLKEVTGKSGVQSMADKDFQKLWEDIFPLYIRVRDKLDEIRKTGVHVWLTAHAVEDMDAALQTGAMYRRLDLMFRSTKKTLADVRHLWRHWADNVFWILRDVTVTEGTRTHRAVPKLMGRRLYTADNGQVVAKTRYQLPPTLPATWEELRKAIAAGTPAPPSKIRAQIVALLDKLPEAERTMIEVELERVQKGSQLSELLSRTQGILECLDDDNGQHDDGAAAAGPSDSATAPAAAAPVDPGDGTAPPDEEEDGTGAFGAGQDPDLAAAQAIDRGLA